MNEQIKKDEELLNKWLKQYPRDSDLGWVWGLVDASARVAEARVRENIKQEIQELKSINRSETYAYQQMKDILTYLQNQL